MSREANLPFPRGETWFGIGASTPSTADQAAMAYLRGKTYTVEDPDYNGQYVTLMIVQYDAATPGTALTADRKMVDYTTDYKVFADLAPDAEGNVSHPLDHKYDTLSIADGDLVYVVVHGPCNVHTTGSPAVGINLVTQTDGTLAAAAEGDNHVIGHAIAATASGHNDVFIHDNVGVE